LTTEAGLSTTSPAAILETTSGDRRRIGIMPQLTCGTLYHAVLVARKTNDDQHAEVVDREDL
jgi:hypothetical protein